METTNEHIKFNPADDYMPACKRYMEITDRGYVKARMNEIKAAIQEDINHPEDNLDNCYIGGVVPDDVDMVIPTMPTNYKLRQMVNAEIYPERVFLEWLINFETWSDQDMETYQLMKTREYKEMTKKTPKDKFKGQWLQEFEKSCGINRDDYEFDEDEFNEFKHEQQLQNLGHSTWSTMRQKPKRVGAFAK